MGKYNKRIKIVIFKFIRLYKSMFKGNENLERYGDINMITHTKWVIIRICYF